MPEGSPDSTTKVPVKQAPGEFARTAFKVITTSQTRSGADDAVGAESYQIQFENSVWVRHCTHLEDRAG
jgi:hypothetical protein